MTAQQRTALYSLALALAAIATAYGIVTKEQAALWVALVPSLTATVVAFRHRPTKG